MVQGGFLFFFFFLLPIVVPHQLVALKQRIVVCLQRQRGAANAASESCWQLLAAGERCRQVVVLGCRGAELSTTAGWCPAGWSHHPSPRSSSVKAAGCHPGGQNLELCK